MDYFNPSYNIHTSYFAKYKESNGLAISLYKPKWYNGDHFPILAPTKVILKKYKKDHDVRSYVEAYYRDVLNKLNPHEIVQLINNRVLLCYEAPDKFCHRFVISEWIYVNTGIVVTEI
jgi:uncharacterized protein YeaO (DUF488 family)